VNNELERCKRKLSWPNVEYCPVNYQEDLRRITNFSHDGRRPCRVVDSKVPECQRKILAFFFSNVLLTL
jgi:hypothetical protein